MVPPSLRPTFRSEYPPAETTFGSSTYGPVAGELQQVSTAETGPDFVHQTTAVVSEAEAKTVRVAKILRMMRDDDTRTEEHSRALDMLINPPTTASVVDNAIPMLFPDCNLAYDEELARLQVVRRKASANAEMMREMESDSFTANLFDRQTGQIVSALDALWNPEYGNRGELESRFGAIISHLDGALSQLAQMPTIHPHLPISYGVIRSTFQYFSSLQIALRMRGLGVFPINQLAFDERDMKN